MLFDFVDRMHANASRIMRKLNRPFRTEQTLRAPNTMPSPPLMDSAQTC